MYYLTTYMVSAPEGKISEKMIWNGLKLSGKYLLHKIAKIWTDYYVTIVGIIYERN